MRVTTDLLDQMICLMAGCPSLMQLGFIVTSVRGDGNVKGTFGWNEMKFTAFFLYNWLNVCPN